MDTKLCLERARNEIKTSLMLNQLSKNPRLQIEEFKIAEPETYYSGVISHSYYAIFFAARAYLESRNVHIKSEQGQHQQVYFEFRKLVKKGEIDKELLKIYEEAAIKAEVLLDIFKKEKGKRSEFTYQKLPQANSEPASESLNNASLFYKTINRLLIE
jgi:uncharacterized protein (UPF0332 family)